MPKPSVLIVSAARTPLGSFNGALAPLAATRLGSLALAEALTRSGFTPEQLDEVIIGHVLSAGVGQAPARQVALGAGLPRGVNCLTVNKVCGSSLKAVMLAADAIALGRARVVAAGGIESMSNAPYLLPQGRRGYRLGHGAVIDSMIKDGLWDVYNDFHMGNGAELCARRYRVTRAEQDEYAAASYNKALEAQRTGAFRREIIPVVIPQDKGEPYTLAEDEQPRRADFKKMPRLPPVFAPDGSVTAGNASPISDGATVMIVAASNVPRPAGVEPLGRILAYTQVATDPEWFSIAPVLAVNKLVQESGVALKKIDLIELHEAFAATTLAVMRELKLNPKRVNVRGGAIALGHPIGASGARILTTLLYALRDLNKHLGLATLCIGGGEAVAILVERA